MNKLMSFHKGNDKLLEKYKAIGLRLTILKILN